MANESKEEEVIIKLDDERFNAGEDQLIITFPNDKK